MNQFDQHKIIEALNDYSHKMKGKDYELFEMLRKRDKDDEDIDAISRKKMMELVEKYVPERYRKYLTGE